jgi:glycosyltransferase involved in cell wall biosynthesis
MIRTYCLLKSLQRDWIVDFVEFGNSTESLRDATVLRPLVMAGNKLKLYENFRPFFWFLKLPFLLYMHQKVGRILCEKLRSERFDAILLDYTKMAHYLRLIKGRRVKKILHVHNAESDVARQMRLRYGNKFTKGVYWLQWKLFEAYEKRFVPRCDLLLAPSQADADFYRRLAPNIKTIVIPNAVDTDALTPLGAPEEPFSLIYPGRMDYAPNAEAVEIFCRQIMPRIAEELPAARFYIVGKNPPRAVRELASERVVVTGYVEDVLPYWRKAAALVVPLAVGGGTRIKILEAMALGRPVVSTSKGSEGLDVRHDKHLLIAEDPRAFAETTIELLRQGERCREMVRAARELVEAKYSFAAVGTLLRNLL